MTSIAIIGTKGYVGSALAAAFSRLPEYKVTPVTREDYENARQGAYDILINSAMPSGRFWAKNNPEADFLETVKKTADLLYKWRFKKFVQISSVSARCELHTIYGRHKAAAEQLCFAQNHLILRLSSMYSEHLQKGALIDILNERKVYVSRQSRYPFASLEFVSKWITQNINRQGIVEVGAKNTVTLSEIADHLHKKITFEGPLENQSLEKPESEFPDARDVFHFLDGIQKKYER